MLPGVKGAGAGLLENPKLPKPVEGLKAKGLETEGAVLLGGVAG